MGRVALRTTDDEQLEARWDGPDLPLAAVVFCHPDPRQQGTMNAPLMTTVTNRLVEHGYAVLRFNFRGVGESTGTHGEGSTEVFDVDAAVVAAKDRSETLYLAGWSFGAATALRWLASTREHIRFVGIAPPPSMLPDPSALAGRSLKLIVGDRDQVVDVEAIRRFAEASGCEFQVVPGSDHFFHFREVKLADAMSSYFSANS